jgi:hypothetical protein
MTRTNENQPVLGPTPEEEGTPRLRAENECLRERLQQFAEEHERDRQTIAALQEERDAYRRALYAWALEQITDEDLQRYAQPEAGVPLDEFIGELEQGIGRAGTLEA